MLITINSVNFEKHDKGYMIANVNYLKDGSAETRQIRSFAAPNVYATLEGYKNFPVDVNVIVKKEGKYWNWKDIESPQQKEGNIGNANPVRPATGKVLGSNYETPEERAKKQVYIVRQSSISAAIELLKAKNPKGVEASIEEVIEVARKFEAYVFDTSLADTPL